MTGAIANNAVSAAIQDDEATGQVETVEISASINQAPLFGTVMTQQTITGVIE